MSRLALFLAVFAVLALSSPTWALSRSSACRPTNPAPWSMAVDGPMCLLVHDPWQDCDEDPWQLTTAWPADTFSDPWQDDLDPWQPTFAASTRALLPDSGIDPWQPVTNQLVPPLAAAPALDVSEDPWQPCVIDPWQDGTEDPWEPP